MRTASTSIECKDTLQKGFSPDFIRRILNLLSALCWGSFDDCRFVFVLFSGSKMSSFIQKLLTWAVTRTPPCSSFISCLVLILDERRRVPPWKARGSIRLSRARLRPRRSMQRRDEGTSGHAEALCVQPRGGAEGLFVLSLMVHIECRSVCLYTAFAEWDPLLWLTRLIPPNNSACRLRICSRKIEKDQFHNPAARSQARRVRLHLFLRCHRGDPSKAVLGRARPVPKSLSPSGGHLRSKGESGEKWTPSAVREPLMGETSGCTRWADEEDASGTQASTNVRKRPIVVDTFYSRHSLYCTSRWTQVTFECWRVSGARTHWATG